MVITVSRTAPGYRTGTTRIVELPSLPHAVAGQFAGSVHGALEIAGGSRWSSPSSQGGTKIFDDSIEAPGADTNCRQMVGRLPRPLGYGGAASCNRTRLLAGEQNHTAASRSVWALSMQGRKDRCARWRRQAWESLGQSV